MGKNDAVVCECAFGDGDGWRVRVGRGVGMVTDRQTAWEGGGDIIRECGRK